MGKLGFHDLNDNNPNIGFDKAQMNNLWLGDAPSGDKLAAVSTSGIWNLSGGANRRLALGIDNDTDIGLNYDLDSIASQLDSHKML